MRLTDTLDRNRFVYVSFALYLILIPWTKLEFVRSITWAEPAFLLVIAALAVRLFAGDYGFLSLNRAQRGLGVLLLLWIAACLLSAINVQFLGTYSFEVGGYIYLSIVCFVCLSISLSEEGFDQVYKWLKISIFIVGAVGTIGLLIAVVTGSVGRFLFAAEDALVATFRKPNQLAGFLSIFIPIAWEELKLARRKSAKLLYSVMLAMLVLTMLFANSKSGLVALALIAAIYFVIFLYRAEFRAMLVVGAIGVGIYVVGLLLADHVYLIGRTYSGMTEFLKQMQFTNDLRIKNWSLAIELFLQNPLTGIGVANTRMINHIEIHNTYLAILAEMGIVGIMAFLSLIGTALYTALNSMQIARALKAHAHYALARAQIIGLVAFLLFATQHMMMRQRYLWIAFGMMFALNWLLRSKQRELSTD